MKEQSGRTTHFRKLYFLVAAISLGFCGAYVNETYRRQASDIHEIYDSMRKQNGDALSSRLTVCQELQSLRQEELSPKSWAVDFFWKWNMDRYIDERGRFLNPNATNNITL
ncbi:MAG: hypothetical protein AABY00_00855 [Nanoarchaeota archaeon]